MFAELYPYLTMLALAAIVAAWMAGPAEAASTLTPTCRRPSLEAPRDARFRFGGFIGARLKVAEKAWLLPVRQANPAMVDMLRDRDRQPRRELLPWSGEFVGKQLTAATLVWRISRSPALRAEIEQTVAALAAAQSPEGYLGPFSKEQRLLRGWDLWGHYHAILGLLLAFEEMHDARALQVAGKAADLICQTFPEGGMRIGAVPPPHYNPKDLEMNEAIIHGLLLLYRETGEPRYLAMAKRVEQDWQVPPSGDYVRTALAGLPFYKTPKPRWESLHDIQAIAELYWQTGEGQYRQALEQIWWSICEGDRHNTGGFSSGEQAHGDPYRLEPIETCCTVSWIALSVDMLRLTGNSIVADEIELSTFNGGIGGQHPSGRWWTYNTPMDGDRKASAHEINFQCRPGSPELNCCSVNGPRILGMISQWALMIAPDGLALNYYGPCTLTAAIPGGQTVTLRQETQYPRTGRITIRPRLAARQRFALRLRIPHWSEQTALAVNGESIAVRPGSYATIEREWRDGDRISLALDMSPHFWVGERECAGKTSIYQGPLLLAFDPRFNHADAPPCLHATDLRRTPVAWHEWPRPWLLVETKGAEGTPVTLCDFASAGATGTQYRSWLEVEGAEPVPFSRENPRRASRGLNPEY